MEEKTGVGIVTLNVFSEEDTIKVNKSSTADGWFR